MFSSDKPIVSLTEDKLNRKSFAKQLAQAIVSYSDHDNFTIGLCGKWGTGKTSIINMIVEEINRSSQNEFNKPIIIRFNPWNYSDKTQLINQFFRTVLLEIGSKAPNKTLKNVGSALQKYADLFEYAMYIPYVGEYLKPIKGIFSGAGKSLSEVAKKKESLESIKKDVESALIKQSQKIIVIIDDIDRLNNEQIRLIFQLVNCVAGFPNMIYLLSFDKSVVTRALEEEQNCNGEEYLEKIIQVPFYVPEAQKEDVHKLLFDQLDKLWFDVMPSDVFEKEYWSRVFNDCLSPFLTTIRDVNRVMNVYRFKYGLLHSETNCIDLLAITVLQVCAPEMFNWIKDNISRLTGSYYGRGTSQIDQKKYEEEILKEFEGITDNVQRMFRILQVLFPRFLWNTGGYSTEHETEDELRYKQKISCADRSPLYFHLSLEDVGIPRGLLVDSINTYNASELDSMFISLIEQDQLSQYAKELKAYANAIPADRKKLLLQKLIHVQTMSFDDKEKGALYISPIFYCEQCCWSILKTMNAETAGEVFLSLIASSDNNQLDVLIKMIVELEEAYGRIGDSISYEFRIVSEEKLADIEDVLLAQIKDYSAKSFLFKSKCPWSLYRFWSFKEPETLKAHIFEGLKDKTNVPYYIASCVITWTTGKDRGWNFKEETIEEYISIEIAYTNLISLKNTEAFSDFDYYIKESIVAFCLWYNSDKTDYHSLVKETIDSKIPEWEKIN